MEQIFKDNPKLDVAYKTADGRYFFLESDAINHAKTLENKKVKKVTPIEGNIKDAVKEVVNESLNSINSIQEDLQEDENANVSTVVDNDSDDTKEKNPVDEVELKKDNKKIKTKK